MPGPMKVLVTGATGTMGDAVCHALKEGGLDVGGLSRHPDDAMDMQTEGITMVRGDLAEPRGLDEAFSGFSVVILITPPSAQTARLKRNALQAAKKARVEHVVSISMLGADPEAAEVLLREHGRADQELKESGMRHTILRPHYLMDNLIGSANDIMLTGTFYQPLGDAKIGMVAAEDVATVTSTILHDDMHQGQAHDLTGPQSLSMDEVAQLLTDVLQTNVRYEATAPETTIEELQQKGVAEEDAHAVVETLGAYAQGRGDVRTTAVEAIVGRPPISFDVWLRQMKEEFLPPSERDVTSGAGA